MKKRMICLLIPLLMLLTVSANAAPVSPAGGPGLWNPKPAPAIGPRPDPPRARWWPRAAGCPPGMRFTPQSAPPSNTPCPRMTFPGYSSPSPNGISFGRNMGSTTPPSDSIPARAATTCAASIRSTTTGARRWAPAISVFSPSMSTARRNTRRRRITTSITQFSPVPATLRKKGPSRQARGTFFIFDTQTPDYRDRSRPRPQCPCPPAADTPLRPADGARTSSCSRSRRSSRWP